MLGVILPLTLLPLSLSFTLHIYHTNDIHARFNERGSVKGGKCKEDQVCYGGMPRHAKYLKDNVNSSANNLILNAGDWFTGTTYFARYTGNLTVHYLDTLNYDAWSLGNHEFDRGPEQLARAVKQIKITKTLSANVEVTGSSGLVVEKSTIKTFTNDDGSIRAKVGIIGYTTPDTKFLSASGPDISFSDVVTAVRQEAGRLTEQGVNIIVALGHAGIETDKAICEQVSDVDVVVGGHTNTFLWNGELPVDLKDDHTVEGPYPISLRDNKCLVVQAFAYGMLIGALEVNFTSAGEVDKYSGNPVLMSSTKYEQDPDALTELKGFSKEVDKYAKIKVGYTNRVIDGTRVNCRSRECELGNVVVDAFLESFRRNDKNVVCAFINSGSITNSIDEGDITYEDLLTVLPFGNTVDRVSITGSVLKKVLEHSVSIFNATGFNVEDRGTYLQVSGIKVYYSLTRDVGSRVVQLLIQTPSGGEHVDVEDDKEYACAGITYILAGNDGYTMLGDLTKIDGEEDVAALRYFVGEHNPLDKYPALAGIPSRSFFDSAAPSLSSISPTLFINLIFLGLLFRS